MIYHITEISYWLENKEKKDFISPTFSSEGFIHCSNKDQLAGVMQRYFQGKHLLIILHIDEARLVSPLVYEPAAGGELFPHIYGPINRNAIIKAVKLKGI